MNWAISKHSYPEDSAVQHFLGETTERTLAGSESHTRDQLGHSPSLAVLGSPSRDAGILVRAEIAFFPWLFPCATQT